MDMINLINEAANLFFKRNPALDVALPKDLMPFCVELGMFSPEEAVNGWPLRNALNEIDSEGTIHQIPTMKPVRKDRNTYWFFVRKNEPIIV